jgi:DNA-binding CsgD family transcriptional regulator
LTGSHIYSWSDTRSSEVNSGNKYNGDQKIYGQISASPSAIVMIDGNLIQEEGGFAGSDHASLSGDTCDYGSGEKEARWVEQLMQRNVMAIIPRNANPERFAAVLDSVSRGMVCFPGSGLDSNVASGIIILSERQREVLEIAGGGESNKEIGRNLNISAATVKAHLEALFRRLDVKNRTQAAMYYTRATA